jgi:iron(III) transport system ATP-binding protein
VVAGGAAETAFGRFPVSGLADGAEVEVVIRPQHVRLDLDRKGGPPGGDGSLVRARILRARFVGSQSLVELALDHDGSVLKATLPGVFLPGRDTALWAAMPRHRAFVFPVDERPAPARAASA